MIDLLAFAAIAGFAGLGWLRGVKGMALWGLSLVAGSLAGAFLARPVGLWLASFGRLPLLAAVPLAGIAVAGIATGIVRGASLRVGRERALMLENGWEPPTWNRWGGTALSALCGAGIVLFVGCVASATGSLHGREAQVRTSLVGRASSNVGEPVIRMVAGEAVGNTVMAATAADLVANDAGDLIRAADALAQDPEVRAALDDPAFKDALARGDMAALMAQGKLDEILQRVSSELERFR